MHIYLQLVHSSVVCLCVDVRAYLPDAHSVYCAAVVVQAWTQMSKVLPPQAAGGFVRLNSGIKTVFSPNQ